MPRFIEAVDRTNVRMVERGKNLRLAAEARQPFRIMREGLGDDFEGDVAIQLRVTCAEDFTHAARAKERKDFVRAEERAICERHVYFMGTRRLSSSSKCWTTTICGAPVASLPAAFTIRNRWPSAAMS